MIPKIEIANGVAGGTGDTIKKHLLTANELNDKTRMFAEITLAPGCSIGYHEHRGESETYYILSGKGLFNDNGTLREVFPGDVTVTGDGEGHGMEAIGDEPLEMIALILYK